MHPFHRALLLWLLAMPAALANVGVVRLEPRAHDRILVVAPHPDDETLCCAGVVQRALLNGGQAAIVWVTAGDGARFNALLARVTPRSTSGQMLRLGNRRLAEAMAAATVLGVPRDSQFILGYPDRNVRRLLDPLQDQPVRSRYTLRTQIPYALALSPDETVTAARLHADLLQVIQRVRPTWILAPAEEDRHPDHHATGVLVRQVMEAAGIEAGLASYMVHDGQHWPVSRGLKPDEPMGTAPSITQGEWVSFELTAGERSRKAEALRQHRSQMRRMSGFLNAFVRSNELFVVEDLPDADRPRPGSPRR